MIQVTIPGDKEIKIAHVVFDYNGTIARDGKLLAGVKEGIATFSEHLTFHVITADTFGLAAGQLKDSPVKLSVLPPGHQDVAKRDYVNRLGCAGTVAVGNGRNDRLMLKAADLGIAVVLREGAAAVTLAAADIVCMGIVPALELLLHPLRLTATLRS